MVPTEKNILLTFQMAQNGMFLDKFKYDYRILHKKIVLDEILTIFHKITHISFNIGPRVLNAHTLGHPFPSAGYYRGQTGGRQGPAVVKGESLTLIT